MGRRVFGADPSALIGVPWAFTATESAGAGFPDAAASIRATLVRYAPKAALVVGETDISNQETTLDFQPVSALFAAATTLEWLSQGARTVDWWDVNNDGSPGVGDFGLVSSGAPEAEAAGGPLPPLYGEQLASMLTAPGSTLTDLTRDGRALLGFQSDSGNQRRVLLINTNPSGPSTVTLGWFRPGSGVDTATYGPASAAEPDPVARSTSSGGARLTLAAESMVVLSGSSAGR